MPNAGYIRSCYWERPSSLQLIARRAFDPVVLLQPQVAVGTQRWSRPRRVRANTCVLSAPNTADVITSSGTETSKTGAALQVEPLRTPDAERAASRDRRHAIGGRREDGVDDLAFVTGKRASSPPRTPSQIRAERSADASNNVHRREPCVRDGAVVRALPAQRSILVVDDSAPLPQLRLAPFAPGELERCN